MVEPVTQELVLLGGGHSHAIALRMWGMNPVPGVRLTLISEASDTPYSGMVPGHVAGIYDRDQCHIDLRQLARFAGAQFCCDRAIGLDLTHKRVLCAHRPPVAFDWLSIDIGSTPRIDAEIDPAWGDRLLPAKPITQFLARWQALLDHFHTQLTDRLHLAIVGGGVAGVELALSMHHRLQTALAPATGRSPQLAMTVVQRDCEILPGHNRRVRRWVMQELNQRQIQVRCNERAIGIEGVVAEAWLNGAAPPPPTGDPTAPQPAGILRCASGLGIPCDRVVWVTQAMAPPWLAASGLATDASGFIEVDETLRSRSHPFVFATGDIAALPDPRPKAGVFAVRQGKPLFENLRAVLGDRPLRPYRPQRQYLNLIGTGNGQAIASRGAFTARGAWLWRWKDSLDREFMNRFVALPPAMSPPTSPPSQPFAPATVAPPRPDPEPRMYCGGCGSKVGQATLAQVLQRLRAEQRLRPNTDPTILVGLDRPDDAAVVLPPGDRPLIQTLDHFRVLLDDPYTFGQIAAHHCLGDLYAMGATPHSALALATVPYGSPALQAETLYQLLAGVLTVLDQTGATLIGGHTTEGPEIALGLSCNGWGQSGQTFAPPRFQAGDALILTQALGTGTLFVANGANQARGAWIDGAIAAMTHSNQAAAQILADHGAIACTDVTGFGLAGHLLNLLRGSDRRVALDLASLPVFEGAITTLRQGWFSSLHRRNAEADQQMTYGGDRPESRWQDPRWQLLFDPQTSGGLLAVVPGDRAVACGEQLRARGYGDAVQIGVVRSPDSSTSHIRILG